MCVYAAILCHNSALIISSYDRTTEHVYIERFINKIVRVPPVARSQYPMCRCSGTTCSTVKALWISRPQVERLVPRTSGFANVVCSDSPYDRF